MAQIVVLGAGISGHTAAMYLRTLLPSAHSVVVVSPKPDYNWIPSNIWVGVGRMAPEKVVIALKPIYDKLGVRFVQAAGVSIHPDGAADGRGPFLRVASTLAGSEGQVEEIAYDYLINATGPRLRFDRTEGLGPDGGHTQSVCTEKHAANAALALKESIERMKRGERQKLAIGMGHGTCTCEGAAFEYTFNVEHELRAAGVRDKADVLYVTNEADLGDFGVDGLIVKRGGYRTPSRVFAASLYGERGIQSLMGTHVRGISQGRFEYETITGEEGEKTFDFAMLLPPFTGVGLQAFGRDGEDITAALFAANGFMKVDADYTAKTYEQWAAADWPRTYQNPQWRNLFAVGIAFAPPHAISRPRASPFGNLIAPAPPRTGMPSAAMARAVAESVVDMVLGRSTTPTRTSSMAAMGAACVASAGANIFQGSAVAMTMYPVVPDYERFPMGGRDQSLTIGEIGTAGHWIKILLHHMFLYKAKALPGWSLIPE